MRLARAHTVAMPRGAAPAALPCVGALVLALVTAACAGQGSSTRAPERATVAVTPASPAQLPRTVTETPDWGALRDARFWLLDSQGTFSNAARRGGAWLVSHVGIADGVEGEFAARFGRPLGDHTAARSQAPTAADLARLPGFTPPPNQVWILSPTRPPCAAEVEPTPRVDTYEDGFAAVEVAHALRGCDFQDTLDVGIGAVTPPTEMRWRAATSEYAPPDAPPEAAAPWSHPLAVFLVSPEPPNRTDLAPGEQSILLRGVGSDPPLLDLFTGIVWDHAPPNPDEYNACLAQVATHHELGFLVGERWSPLPLAEQSEVHLVGAAVVGDRVEAVVGTRGTKAAILPIVAPGVPGSDWSVLETGVHHDETAVYADPRLGPYCGP